MNQLHSLFRMLAGIGNAHVVLVEVAGRLALGGAAAVNDVDIIPRVIDLRPFAVADVALVSTGIVVPSEHGGKHIAVPELGVEGILRGNE